jgi:hypothetical protein
VEKRYHIVGKGSSEELGRFLAKNGQVLLPMVELIEQSKMAVDELIAVLGRATIEAVLKLSAEGIAGPPHPGKKSGEIGWHGLGGRHSLFEGEEAAGEATALAEEGPGRRRRVCRWRDGKMVLRWAAAALLMTEQNSRKIMGYRDLWMLKAALDQKGVLAQQEVA